MGSLFQAEEGIGGNLLQNSLLIGYNLNKKYLIILIQQYISDFFLIVQKRKKYPALGNISVEIGP